MRIRTVVGTVIVALTSCSAQLPEPTYTSPPLEETTDEFTPILGEVLSTPRLLPATDGLVHIDYELFLNNVTSQTATISSIAVVDETGQSIHHLVGDAIDPWMRVLGSAGAGRVIGPGQSALVWIDVVLEPRHPRPVHLAHEITFDFEPGDPPIITSEMTEHIAATTVATDLPVQIGPPLAGAGWLNGNGCCAMTPHRTAINAINGQYHAPERYAMDYVRLSSDDSFIAGPLDELDSYPYYGEEILAVGEGPIVSMRFDLPDQTPGANPTGLRLDEYGGNNVVQQIGTGVYAFYAHLQPDNVANLQVGDVLEKGDMLGLLGNSGNSDSPHLHFHLMDSPSALGSNGIPFVVDSYVVVGDVARADFDSHVAAGGPFALDRSGSREAANLYPLWLTVIDFPEK